ncbi:hypothetical protein [Rhizobium cauense]|nr:hypothetical protein [Rhizobium cauense]
MKAHHRIFYIQFWVAVMLGAPVCRIPELQRNSTSLKGRVHHHT